MDVKKVALLVGALVIAIITAVMAKNMFSGAGADSANAAPAVPLGPKIMVAKKALPVGTIIDAESLVFQAWPKNMVQNAYYAQGEPDADLQKLIGTVVRHQVTAGQPLTRGAVVGPNDRGFLAAALGPGMRAVTFSVSTTAGVAGFIFPGDHVDVVLTQQVPGGGDGPPLKVSETIIRNLRILATDQRLDSKNEDGKTVIKKANTVTVEVTPKLAEKIAVAQELGSLSLMLRSIADNQAELDTLIAAGNVKVPEGASLAEERKILLAAGSRTTDGATTYATGGDVSRFQRRSIPSRAPSTGSNGSPAPANPISAIPTGPSVRVARGNNVTIVPVGAR